MKKIEIKVTKTQLGEILYGDPLIIKGFSKKEINQDIKTKIDMLSHIYSCIDEEEYNELHTCDLFALGDIINLLNNLKITIEGE
jgi:hypothetical protein